MTPMLQQYFDLKKQCGDETILFFRMGDFYEIFGEDALRIAPLLNILITHRNKEDKMPFCGVPHHSYRPYCRKLVDHGFKVAIAEQIASNTNKGILRRKIVKVITPGLRDDLDSLDADCPNYLASIYEEPKSRSCSLILADISTGELRLGQFADNEQTLAFIDNNNPQEILARLFQHDTLQKRYRDTVSISQMPETVITDTNERQRVLSSFLTPAIRDRLSEHAKINLAAFACYLRENSHSLDNFLTVKPLFSNQEMSLATNVVRDLEIFATIQTANTKESLYATLNNTLTPMGARFLRHSLLHPLTDPARLTKRITAVANFVESGYSHLEELRLLLKGFPDLERLSNRLVSQRITPEQLSTVAKALVRSLQVSEHLSLDEHCRRQLADLQNLLQRALLERPGKLGSGVEVFRSDYDTTLGQHIELATCGEEKIASYEKQLREQTSITSLKIKRHKSFGLLIEVSRANVSKVPSSFTRRQTMVASERFVTEQLMELDALLANAVDKAIECEAELYTTLVSKLVDYHRSLLQLSCAVAELDFKQNSAFIALRNDYCRPQLGDQIDLKGCRHPVIESLLGRHAFVANDIEIGCQTKTMVITGPNMAGKSTIMRQLAIAAIMHQSGLFVPATQATLPIFDNIFTRIGASDNITAGQSTFMVEMTETSTILREASPASLVIVDEIGRGTSTADGLALARAILENLALIRCYCIFSTHFHELLPATAEITGIKNMQTEVQQGGYFSHRLVPGYCSRSFGIEVAKRAGLPAKVIDSAKKFLSNPPTAVDNDHDDGDQQLLQQVATKFDDLNLYQITPLQALNFVSEIKGMLRH